MGLVWLASETAVNFSKTQKFISGSWTAALQDDILYSKQFRRQNMEEYSQADARAYIADKFAQQGDFNILPKDVFDRMLDKVMELDEAFMAEAGVNDGAVYDDDQAFDYMMEKLQAAFPEQKMYAMRFVEDYMEYSEAYLESAGLIEWE